MSDAYLGEIRIFAGKIAPNNWVFCDGAKLPMTGNEALFSLLGTVWGGDGRTTFGVPDLRGRLAVGQGNGTKLTPLILGQTGGVEVVTLTEAEIPAHTHTANITPTAATTTIPGPTVMPAQVGAPYVGFLPAAEKSTTFAFDDSMIRAEGGNAAHDNIMPYVTLNYIICTIGTYPTKHQ